MASADASLYDPSFVANLFDEMAATYGVVNYISSFGFCRRWRIKCVEGAGISPGMTVYDLMSGMGECWPTIARHLQQPGTIRALDISPTMCTHARERSSPDCCVIGVLPDLHIIPSAYDNAPHVASSR